MAVVVAVVVVDAVVSLSEPGEPNGRLGNASRMVPLRLIAGDFCDLLRSAALSHCTRVAAGNGGRGRESWLPVQLIAAAAEITPSPLLAAVELFGLPVDDTITACDRSMVIQDARGDNGRTPAMSIDTVDRLAGQLYT